MTEPLSAERTETPKLVFELAFREHGLPLRTRTGNGAPFASPAIGGLSRLSIWRTEFGSLPERIDVGRPEQDGRHERMGTARVHG